MQQFYRPKNQLEILVQAPPQNTTLKLLPARTLYMDPVKIPVASSSRDLTQVFPELGILTRATGDVCVLYLDILV